MRRGRLYGQNAIVITNNNEGVAVAAERDVYPVYIIPSQTTSRRALKLVV